MNVGFITPSTSRSAGGIFEIELRLGQSLAVLPDTVVKVFGLRDEFTAQDETAWLPLRPQTFSVCGLRAFGYAPRMSVALAEAGLNVAHLHALWMFTSVAANRWARAQKRPYIITLNGMLDPWAIRNSHWKKKLALWLYEQRCLTEAACIQVNSQAELESARAFGLKNPLAIIPNGIDLPDCGKPKTAGADLPWAGAVEPGRKVLLFLSRIHPKKGLVNLLKAWAEAKREMRDTENWVLAIAGWDQGGHEAELKKLATEIGIRWADVSGKVEQPSSTRDSQCSLLFLGPQFNEAKRACYTSCDAFILPSFSEGLPMVVLEAWAHAKPVLMTPECNLPEGFAAGAAMQLMTAVKPMAVALRTLMATPASALVTMGNNGERLVRERFTWPVVARQMRQTYEWIISGGQAPDFVKRL